VAFFAPYVFLCDFALKAEVTNGLLAKARSKIERRQGEIGHNASGDVVGGVIPASRLALALGYIHFHDSFHAFSLRF
jgi:hypothetical protein